MILAHLQHVSLGMCMFSGNSIERLGINEETECDVGRPLYGNHLSL